MTREEAYAEELGELDDDDLYDKAYTERNSKALDLIAREMKFRGLEVPRDMRKKSETFCSGCGQLKGVKEYDSKLWDLYYRWDGGGRQYIEPLVYTQDDLYDAGYPDDDAIDAVKMSMEKNMIERGLCSECGRPNLAGISDDEFMTEEEAKEIADMYAEMAAERRAGC